MAKARASMVGRLGAAEAICVADMIRSHCDILPPTRDGRKVMRYHEGWSDQRVAKKVTTELGFTPRSEAITRLRQRAIGVTESVFSTSDGLFGGKGPFSSRVARIESEIAMIKKHLGLSTPAPVALETAEEEPAPEAREEMREPHYRIG